MEIGFRTINEIASDFGVSEPTAIFLAAQKSIKQSAADYPEGTPAIDLINIKVKAFNIESDEAELLVGLELGIIQKHFIHEIIVYV